MPLTPQGAQANARRCPVCGSALLVTLNSAHPEEGGLRQVCNECERRRLLKERSGLRQISVNTAKLLIYAGVLLTLLTLAVDRLSISGQAGFGWRQITGTEVGLLCLIVGLLAGRGLFAIAGLFMVVLSVGADVLNLGNAPGLGWRSQTALAVAVLLVAGGMLWQLALKRGNARPPGNANREAQR